LECFLELLGQLFLQVASMALDLDSIFVSHLIGHRLIRLEEELPVVPETMFQVQGNTLKAIPLNPFQTGGPSQEKNAEKTFKLSVQVQDPTAYYPQ
jgi:hypothetical protein